MFKIAICDDDIHICNQIEIEIKKNKNMIGIKIEMEIFITGERLCKCLEFEHFDLIFLDIEFKKMDGISVGKFIRETLNDESTHIVFISSKESYAMSLFDVRPLNFLIKPISGKNIVEMINRVVKLNSINSFFSYKIGREIFRINTKDIIFFESLARKIRIVTLNEEIICYETMNNIIAQLDGKAFYQVHKSYIVNYAHIIRFNYNELMMVKKFIIPISQSNRKVMRKVQIDSELEEY